MRSLALLALLALTLLLAGCSTNREDPAIFEQGWIKPEEGASRRMYGLRPPPAPEKAAEPAAR